MSQTRLYEMKDSGVEWIGEMPSHWDKRRLKTLLKVLRGGSPRPIEEYLTDSPDGVNWIKIGDTTKGVKQIFSTKQKIIPSGVAKSRMVHKGDLLLTNSMSFGEAYFLETDGCIHDGWVCLTQLSGIDKLFLYYFLCSNFCSTQFQLQVDGGVVQNLNIDKIGETFTFLPTIPEQTVIAAYLDEKCAAIDAIIAEATATIDEYKDWKASVIFEAVTKGLNPNAEMKDSGVEWIGEMPKHWTICKIKHLCSMQAGKNLTSEQIENNGDYPVFGGNGIRGYFHSFNQDRQCILVGRQGALCGNVHRVCGKFWATDHAVVTIPSTNETNNHLFYLLTCMNLNQYASETTAQPGLSVSLIQNIKTILTPLSEQTAIAAYLDEKCAAIDGVIAEKETLIGELETYKKSLIFETVTGKRRVC